jgi:hypothetical protein
MTKALTTSGKSWLEVQSHNGGNIIRRGTARVEANKRSATVRVIIVSREERVRQLVK